MNRKGVEHPDSPVEEIVFESGGFILQSPPWWQQAEEPVRRVGGATCNPGAEASVVSVQLYYS